MTKAEAVELLMKGPVWLPCSRCPESVPKEGPCPICLDMGYSIREGCVEAHEALGIHFPPLPPHELDGSSCCD